MRSCCAFWLHEIRVLKFGSLLGVQETGNQLVKHSRLVNAPFHSVLVNAVVQIFSGCERFPRPSQGGIQGSLVLERNIAGTNCRVDHVTC
jgi:hypothetical protein